MVQRTTEKGQGDDRNLHRKRSIIIFYYIGNDLHDS